MANKPVTIFEDDAAFAPGVGCRPSVAIADFVRGLDRGGPGLSCSST